MLALAHAAHAQSIQGNAPRLVIGTHHVPPFAIKQQNGSWDGISIELWNEIASDNHWDFEFREMDLAELLKATESGELDATVAAVTVTPERLQTLDFSQPYYLSGLGIAVRKAYRHNWSAGLLQLLAWQFLAVLGFLAAVTVCVGCFMWLAERQHNPDHFGGVLGGLGHGIWWAVVTMTTVGYGDKTPRTLPGRMLAVLWMLIGVVSLAVVTGSVAAQITVTQLDSPIRTPEDFSRVRTGTVLDSASEAYLQQHGYGFQIYETQTAALSALTNHDIDAVVYNYPSLRYEIHSNFSGLAEVLSMRFQQESHAIALPPNSGLRKPINISLLRIISAPHWEDTEHRHMGH